jgi:DNA-binding Lrp family transcriptional regulator
MTITAFVLIVVDPIMTADVFDALGAVKGIREVYQVMGPYDIVAVITVNSLVEVSPLVSKEIRGLEGVVDTTTCVTFPE